MGKIYGRVRYFVMRSPLARTVKRVRRWRAREIVAERRQLARSLSGMPEAAVCAVVLERDGYAMLTDLVDQASLASLAAAARSRTSSAAAMSGAHDGQFTAKSFWTRLLDSEMIDGKLRSDSPFVQFALQPGILAFVAQVMGDLPRLDYVLLTLSRPTGEALQSSQLWHRDYDDTKTIKIFVYLSDVASLADGPFTFIPGPESDGLGFTLHSHQHDDRVFSKLPQAQKQEMFGSAMSVFAVNTSRCLHMGSRVEEGHSRLLYTATFTSYPKAFSSDHIAFALDGSESELVRAIIAPDDFHAAPRDLIEKLAA